MSRRGAGRNSGKIRSAKTVAYGDMTRGNVRYHLGNKEWIEAWRAVTFGKVAHLFLERPKPTNTRTPYYSRPVRIHFSRLNAGIFQRFIGAANGKMDKRVHLAGFFAV